MGPEYMAAQLAALTSEKREAFYQLHHSGVQTTIPELDIILTNGFQMGDSDDTGIFLISSRINHTCFPNISSTWQEDKGKRQFHAIKAIKKGGEIGFPYVNQLDTKENRQKQLMAKYGFLCRCTSCLLGGKALLESDKRRAELKIIDNELDTGLVVRPILKLLMVSITDHSSFGFTDHRIDIHLPANSQIEKALLLLDAEQLVGPKYNFLSPGYQINYSVLGNLEQARLWAARAYEAGRISFGEYDERVVRYKEWMVTPGAEEPQPLDSMALAMMAQMRMQDPVKGAYKPPFFNPGFPFSPF
jgi:hypothetical protein